MSTLAPSNPDIVLRSPVTPLASGIDYTARLNQQELDLLFCVRLVFYTLGDDKHLPGSNMNGTIPKIDSQIALDHDERFIGLQVIVPDEIALQLHDLELIVV